MPRVWVPTGQIAAAVADLPGVEAEIFDGRPGGLPPGAEDAEFYVPPFFPTAASVEALTSMPKLRVVQTITAGVDRFVPHLPPGVTLCNARGVHDAGTAEWVVAAVLASLHDFDRFAREQPAGHWDYHFTDSLAGKTVLIVGYGSIGQAVGGRLAGFEVDVLKVARSARPGVAAITDLPELLPRADVVVLLAPVTPETAGMVDAAFLARMKDGALFVNAARGSLVVTDALVAELRSGRLRAALDVTDPEPLPAGHPLWSEPGVLITPHVAASTPASIRRAAQLVREQLDRYLRGEELRNVITGRY
jgi:phosphoglycerate dehydrogenase-like enzyme